jgi:hypothetical protein
VRLRKEEELRLESGKAPGDLAKVGRTIKDLSQLAEPYVIRTEKGIVDALGEGDYKSAGAIFGNALGNYVPQIAVGAATGTGGLFATLGASKFVDVSQNLDETDKSELMKGIVSTGKALTEAVPEALLGAGRIGRLLSKASPAGKRVMVKSMVDVFKRSAIEGAKQAPIEGFQEGMTQMGDNLIDIFSGDKEWSELYDNVDDAVVVGAGLGFLGGGFGGGVNARRQMSQEAFQSIKKENPNMSDTEIMGEVTKEVIRREQAQVQEEASVPGTEAEKAPQPVGEFGRLIEQAKQAQNAPPARATGDFAKLIETRSRRKPGKQLPNVPTFAELIDQKSKGQQAIKPDNEIAQTIKTETQRESSPLKVEPVKGVKNFVDKMYDNAEFVAGLKSQIRSERGAVDRQVAMNYEKNQNNLAFFDRVLGNKEGFGPGKAVVTDYITDIQKGNIASIQSKYGSNVRKMAQNHRQRLEQAYELNKENTEGYIENYFPHIWKDAEQGKVFTQNYAKKFGKPGFTKERVFDYFSEGIEAGLEPKFWNPEEMVQFREKSGLQYKMTTNLLEKWKKDGTVKFFNNLNDMRGQDYLKPDHPAFEVYYQNEQGERVLAGFYAVRPEAAKVVNNWLSPSLWSKDTAGGKVFRAGMRVKNPFIGVKLALSGFHFLEVNRSAIANQAVNAAKAAGVVKKVKEGLKIPIAPVTDLVKGHKITKAYYKGAKPGTWEYEAVQRIKRAGGTPRTSKKMLFDSYENAKRAFRQSKWGKGVLKSFQALPEVVMKPLMDYDVPYLKVAAFDNMAQRRIMEEQQRNPNLTEKQKDIIYAESWDLMDNRYGQVVYDNLFWNRSVQDSLSGASLSLGWNLGTIREFGGATVDLGKIPTNIYKGKNPITERMMYGFTYTLTHMLTGAMLQYLITGFGPEEMLDYFYPRTGGKNSDGSDERLLIPSQLKEAVSLSEAVRKEGPVMGPLTVATHKIAPPWAMGIQMLQNKDYYGVNISDAPSASWQWTKDYGYFIYDFLRPISVSSASRQVAGPKYLPYLGLAPAPRYVTRTVTQKKIYDALSNQFGERDLSKEKWAEIKGRSELREKIYRNEHTIDDIKNAIKNGFIKPRGYKDLNNFIEKAKLDGDLRAFYMLYTETQSTLLQQMSKEELKRYVPMAHEGAVINFRQWLEEHPEEKVKLRQ